VAQLACEAIRSAQQLAIGNDSRSNPGSDRDEKKVIAVRSRTFAPFGDSCTCCIVLDPDPSLQSVFENPLRVEFDDIDQVGRSAQHTRTGYESG
jgi:hypothetical protein